MFCNVAWRLTAQNLEMDNCEIKIKIMKTNKAIK